LLGNVRVVGSQDVHSARVGVAGKLTDGSIKTATDCSEYSELITELVEAHRDRLGRIEFLPTAGAQAGECVGTNCERRYLKAKRLIYTIAVRKI
jgi:hypothetical protein